MGGGFTGSGVRAEGGACGEAAKKAGIGRLCTRIRRKTAKRQKSEAPSERAISAAERTASS
jgi:hypothetical protein